MWELPGTEVPGYFRTGAYGTSGDGVLRRQRLTTNDQQLTTIN
jgi:hypothetical protein